MMKPAGACGFSFGVGLGSLYAVPHIPPKTETHILASVQLRFRGLGGTR